MGEAQGIRRSARVALLCAGILALTAAAFFTLNASSADAKPCGPYVKRCPVTVKPTLIRTHADKPGDEETVIPHRQERLPFTGADLTLFAATGVAAIGTGGILVRASRSRRKRS